MEVKIKELKAIRVATLRHIGPYNLIGDKISELCRWGDQHSSGGKKNAVMAIYYDNPDTTSPEQLRSDAALSVSEDVNGEGEVKISVIEGGLYAVGTYVGPYSDIGKAWGEFMNQLGKMGFRSRSLPCYEIYVSDPCNTPESELITEFYEPVEPK